MTTTPTQQPEALKLADVLHEVASLFCFPSALLQSAAELRRLHAENETLKLQLLKATTPPMTERAWAEYCLAHRTVDATDQFGEKVRGACNGVAP